MSDAAKITPVRPDDIAGFIIQCHDGDAKAAVETLLGEIEHLQEQLSLAVAIMGKGYTRGWKPNLGSD